MKRTFTGLLVLLTLVSCKKSLEKQKIPGMTTEATSTEEYKFKLNYGTTDRPQRRGLYGDFIMGFLLTYDIGRASVWLTYKDDYNSSSRADYAEFLISDMYTSDLDEYDLKKKLKDKDNFYIENRENKTSLWKELRAYTNGVDTLNYIMSDLTAEGYFLRINGSNIPTAPIMYNFYVYDRYMNSLIEVPRDNRTVWYDFTVAGTDLSNGILPNDKKRFCFIMKGEIL